MACSKYSCRFYSYASGNFPENIIWIIQASGYLLEVSVSFL